MKYSPWLLGGALAGVALSRSPEGRRAKAPGRLWKRVKGVRIYRDVDWDQYVVAPDLDDEVGFYYTDDPEDAVQTAGWIAENEPWSVAGRAARGRRDHLVVGEEAKYSDFALDDFEVASRRPWWSGLKDRKRLMEKRFTVVKVTPQGYWVRWPDGKISFRIDRQLVAADSTTRKWPGNHYRGRKPHKK